MHAQLAELVERYGPGVMWFDGEWEGTWTHEHGMRTYDLVRELDPRIIVNNRVDTGRTGMAGLTRAGGYRGDFGTPEQEIPSTGLPAGVDWETCMTMNRSWGYQSFDTAFKSVPDLLHKLVDIASKGGNFLLNIGPDERGRFPEQSVQALEAIGRWMGVNGESIHGTSASPFAALDFGRCTRKTLPSGGTRLYLHVFERPANGELVLPGIITDARRFRAHLLADPGRPPLAVRREGADLVITIDEASMIDPIDTVVTLDLWNEPLVVTGPEIGVASGVFVEPFDLVVGVPDPAIAVHVTTDGSDPTRDSRKIEGSLRVGDTTTLRVQCFAAGIPVGVIEERTFTRVEPKLAVQPFTLRDGLNWQVFLGAFKTVNDFADAAPDAEGDVATVDLSMQPRDENFGVRLTGFIDVPETGVWRFALDSDDGSTLRIHDELVIDNDGYHSALEKRGEIALAKGLHPIQIDFFEATGQDDLILKWARPGSDEFVEIPAEALKR